jgi:putative transposase
VLAICDIRSPNETFENTFPCLSCLADSREGEENRKAFTSSSHTGVTSTMHGILTFIKRMTSLCLQSLHHRFVDWTKPSTPSLVLGTLTDQACSKSELVAENALLRKPLIVLRRHVKRPACATTDRMLLVLLARMVRTWKQALFIVQEDDAFALASSAIQTVLEMQVQSGCSQTKDSRRNRGVAQGDGEGQSASSERNGSAASCSSWVLASASARSRRTCGTHARLASSGQSWATFLRHHTGQIWACAFLHVTDLCFRSLCALFISALQSRRVLYVGVTRSPPDAWTAQHLREATPYGQTPK